MREFKHPDGMTQRLALADLTRGGGAVLTSMVQKGRPVVVYGDPPWSPGNEKWWRRHAELAPPMHYSDLLGGWCGAVAALRPVHVFCEQSVNAGHRKLFLDAFDQSGCGLGSAVEYVTTYGSPKRENILVHYGPEISTDPTGMSGVPMTRAVFAGIEWPAGSVVVDPCIGKGMVSRLAHEFGLDCVGTELNPKRLNKTISWLLKKGYIEGEDDTASRVATYNRRVARLATSIADICDDPALSPQLLPAGSVVGNAYNPNKVAAPELDLLELSIREDGLTMAVVVMAEAAGWTVIDGFHRHTVLTKRLGRDYVACTVLDKELSERMASTVRHNRARGKHHVDLMATLVNEMHAAGVGDEEIAEQLGMTTEELLRLQQMVGAARLLAAEEYSKSWGKIDDESS